MIFYTDLTAQVDCVIEDDVSYGDPIELDLFNEFISGPHLKNVFYIPSLEDSVKTIRLNLHVVQKSDGSGNFTNDSILHMTYLESLEPGLNKLFSNLSPPMYNGPTNDFYIADSRIRFYMDSIYFHQDDIGFTNNGSVTSSYNYNNYGIDKCNTINIFIAGSKDTSYHAPAGAGLAGNIVLYNLYRDYTKKPPGTYPGVTNHYGGSPWMIIPLIGHEIGHCLGLPHSWVSCNYFPDMDCPQNDEWCSPNKDANHPVPKNPQGNVNCSNNMMGYSNTKTHLTPLQLGHIHQALSTSWRKRFLKSCEFDSNLTRIITTDENWEYAKAMSGDVIIEPGANLTIKNEISMPTNGKFIVRPGGTLIVDGGKLTNTCCNNFWHGIIVEGNYYENQQPDANGNYKQGRLILKNNAIIQHAREAIRTKGADGQFRTGGIIQATDAKIINCRRAVEFLKYQNLNSNNVPIPNKSFFKRCEFKWDNGYLGDLNEDTQTALVTLWDVHGVSFQACTFTSKGNVQNGLKRGRAIYALDATIKVTGYCHLNLPNCNVVESVFNGFHTAIQLSGSGLSGSKIKNCFFDDNLLGINLQLADNSKIIFNTFSLGGHPYFLNEEDNFEYHTAIYSDETSSFIIEENNIYADSSPQTTHTHGIVIKDSGENSNRIYKNQCTDIEQAIVAINQNIHPNFHYGLKILCNTNEGSKNDIQVRDKDFIYENYPQLIGIDRNQDDGSFGELPAGNTFSQPDGDPDNFVNLSFAGDYFYDYKHVNNSYAETPHAQEYGFVLGYGDFQFIPTSAINTCPTNFPPIILEPEVTVDKYTVNNDDFNDLLYNYHNLIDNGNTEGMIEDILLSFPEDAWELRDELILRSPYNSDAVLIEAASKNILPQAMLLEVLLANPDALQSGEVIRYVENEIQNPLPRYMIELLWLSRDQNTLRSNIEKSIRHKHYQKNQAQINLVALYLTDSIYYNIDSAKFWIGQNKNYDGILSQIAIHAGERNYTIAMNKLDSLSISREWPDSYYAEMAELKNIYLLLDEVYAGNRDESQLNENEKSTLRRIAYEEVGKASVIADQILCFFYDQCKMNMGMPKSNNTSYRPKKKDINQAIANNSLKVYPNPGNQYTTLGFNFLTHKAEQRIRITDVNGREIMKWEIDEQTIEGQVLWDCRTAVNGIYFAQLWQNDELIVTKKIVVQH